MRQAINIRLDKEVVQYLDDSAQILEKTRTNLIERAIDAYFKPEQILLKEQLMLILTR